MERNHGFQSIDLVPSKFPAARASTGAAANRRGEPHHQRRHVVGAVIIKIMSGYYVYVRKSTSMIKIK